MPKLQETGVVCDLAFIDGYHTFDHMLVDFFLVDRILRVGGIVVFHDVGYPGVRKACRFVALNRAYRVLACGPGSRVSRRTRFGSFISRMPLFAALRRTLLRPELVCTDASLGIFPGTNMVAFEKLGEDDRRWDHYVEF